jgi:regulatory protein
VIQRESGGVAAKGDNADASKPAPRKPSLRTRALQWLANREHSRHELRTKLLRAAQEHDDAAAQIDALLDHLIAQGLLNERRFVESRVHARQARLGTRRIEYELRQHHVALDPALQAQLRASELARAREVWRKKFGCQASDAAGHARQARFLFARGFSADVVHKLVSSDHDDESI